MTWLISDEARKHRAFREVWVAYLLGGLYLLLGLYTEISEQNYSVLYDAQQKWNFVQQNICLLYTSPSPRDRTRSRMPSSA